MTDNRVLWDIDAETVNALFGEALNTNRASIGLPPVRQRPRLRRRPPAVGRHRPVLDPWEGMADLDVVQTGAWMLPDPSPLPDAGRRSSTTAPPPVYVGFGSMPMHTSTDLARVVVDAVRAQGRRVVVMRGWADLSLIDGEDDCLVVGEVNHHALFRRVAAVVHHGGAGTTTRAAAAGAPQVVVPQASDQPYWARPGRRAGHRRGPPTVRCRPSSPCPPRSGSALAPETRARAIALAGTVRADGAAVAATLLVDAASRERSPVSA